MRILEDLYFGNINFNGYLPASNHKAQKVINRLDAAENNLMQKLQGEEKAAFIDFASAQAELTGITAVENFIIGFSTGAALLAEVNTVSSDMLL